MQSVYNVDTIASILSQIQQIPILACEEHKEISLQRSNNMSNEVIECQNKHENSNINIIITKEKKLSSHTKTSILYEIASLHSSSVERCATSIYYLQKFCNCEIMVSFWHNNSIQKCEESVSSVNKRCPLVSSMDICKKRIAS